MKRLFPYSILTGLLIIPFLLNAQNNETFKSHGQAFGRLFANFHQGIGSASSDEAAFELVRAYLGYEHFISNEFSAKINLDIGSPDDLSEHSKIRRYAYFKNAYVQYQKGELTTQFGLINLRQFDLQEKVWERRYLKKSFADEYKLGSSADLGVMVDYQFSDLFSADATVMNGEGYSSLQADNIFKYALGTTFNVSNSFIFRGYIDYIYNKTATITPVFFISYSLKNNFNIGAEYNYQFNNNFADGQDLFGYSVFAKYNLKSWLQVFCRFDKLQSNIPNGETTPWNLSKDGSSLIGGFQFAPVKGIKIALDYQDWVPWAANQKTESFIFIDLEVRM